MTRLLDVNAHQAHAFGTGFSKFQHRFGDTGSFTDERLADPTDSCPPHDRSVEPVAPVERDRPPVTAALQDLSWADLPEEIRDGRVRLCLRRLERRAPDCLGLVEAAFARIEVHASCLSTDGHASTLLVEPPRERLPYRMDATLIARWQLRGRARLWLCDTATPTSLPDAPHAIRRPCR